MYYFFINDNLLPVPPSKMEIKINNKNKTINLINDGEINIIKTPGLTEISFEIMLPNAFYPFASYGNNVLNYMARMVGVNPQIKYAKEYTNIFKQLKQDKKSFRVIITRMGSNFEYLSDTNMLVTLEEYSILESTDYGFDWIIPMRFKQYQPYATKELEITKNEKGEEVATVKKTRPTTKEVPKSYKTAFNMSLWEASRRASGGSLDWRKIAVSNSINNPNNVPKGTILKLD